MSLDGFTLILVETCKKLALLNLSLAHYKFWEKVANLAHAPNEWLWLDLPKQ